MEKRTLLLLVAPVLAIIGLASGGPFINPLCPNHAEPVIVEYLAGDTHIYTSAGIFDETKRAFRTDNKAGWLVFGPYLVLEPGRYSVSWSGVGRKGSRPEFEVYSEGGGIVAAEAHLIEATEGARFLKKIEFNTKSKINGAEFRVLVSASDELEVRSIKLIVYQCNR
jgi:hypothetical protein